MLVKIGLDSEKQRQIKRTASTDSLPLLSRLNFHPSFLTSLLPHSTEQCREWGLWSAHSSSSLLLLLPHTFHFSSAGAFHRVHPFMNCSRAGSSMGCSMDICSSVWSTSSPPSSLTLVFARLLSLFLHSPWPVWHFYPFLNTFSQRCHLLGCRA